MKYLLYFSSFMLLLTACGQKKESVRIRETENILFDAEFEKNYFSPLIVDAVLSDIKKSDASALIEKMHPKLKEQITTKVIQNYFELISDFYGEALEFQPSLNSKFGVQSNIGVKCKYTLINTDIKLVFVETESKEVKLAQFQIKPIKPIESKSTDSLCAPIITLIKDKNIDELYSKTTNEFQTKFEFELFKNALNKHLDQYDYLSNFQLIDQSIGVVKKGEVVITAEYVFEYKQDTKRTALLMFQEENDTLKVINIDFSTNDK